MDRGAHATQSRSDRPGGQANHPGVRMKQSGRPGLRCSVLIVEDEVMLARNMARFLDHRGLVTSVAGTLSGGIAQYDDVRPDIVFVDHNLSDGNGIALIRHVRKLDAGVKVVMITAHDSIALAVEAMKAGA